MADSNIRFDREQPVDSDSASLLAQDQATMRAAADLSAQSVFFIP